MNTHHGAWKDNSQGNTRQYDFSPQAHWSGERLAAEHAAILTTLEAGDAQSGSAPEPWTALALRLPAALRAALLLELRAGNELKGIGSSGWPGEGSIVVNVKDRFTAAKQALPLGVHWRELNDPHYCREELSHTQDGVEHLIIA